MPLSLASVKSDFYTAIKSGSAFSTFRASLGNGSASVIPAAELSEALPTAPFVAVAFGPLSGAPKDARTLFPTLWLYDNAAQGHFRLNALAVLLEAQIGEDEALIAGVETRLVGIDREFIDPSLKRPVLPVRLSITGRF